jgi:hypothetical protein
MEKRQASLAVKRAAAQAQARAAAAASEDDDDDDDLDERPGRMRLRLSQLPLHACAVVLGFAAVVFLVLSFFRTVPSGTVAVPVTFGKAGKQVSPGLHLEWPITKMKSISTRTQSYTMATNGDDPTVQVLGSDAAGANADATLLFRVVRSQATNVYDNLGGGYATTVVRPTARNCIRDSFAQGALIEEATVRSSEVEQSIGACIRKTLEPSGIKVQAFQLRQLTLSAQLTNAIEGQVAAKLLGVKVVDPAYLQFYYIQVLQQFAKSKNNGYVITDPGAKITIPTPGPTTGN